MYDLFLKSLVNKSMDNAAEKEEGCIIYYSVLGCVGVCGCVGGEGCMCVYTLLRILITKKR